MSVGGGALPGTTQRNVHHTCPGQPSVEGGRGLTDELQYIYLSYITIYR